MKPLMTPPWFSLAGPGYICGGNILLYCAGDTNGWRASITMTNPDRAKEYFESVIKTIDNVFARDYRNGESIYGLGPPHTSSYHRWMQ